jgi:serine/threonine protein phosphatase 1
MRTLAVGDVHGCSTALDAVLAAVRPAADDLLIFLGDYVDRGPDSRGVIDRLLALRQAHRVVALRGNHELMMWRARADRSEFRMWCSVGGAQTLASYGKFPGRAGGLADVPDAHWEFLERTCMDYYETDTHIFAHAGVDPGAPLAEQSELWLFWEFLNPEAPIAHESGKTLVCGHTSQRSGEVLDLGTTICIDTNIYADGWLTCLDVTGRRYWQAKQTGEVRTGVLGQPRETR